MRNPAVWKLGDSRRVAFLWGGVPYHNHSLINGPQNPLLILEDPILPRIDGRDSSQMELVLLDSKLFQG